MGAGMTNAERHAIARELFEERAAILQHEAGFPKDEAESLARIETAEWLKAHPLEQVQP